ncbi:MAG: hypothetical protein P8Y63_06720, partial [Deltaproteobacteria bacterium]
MGLGFLGPVRLVSLEAAGSDLATVIALIAEFERTTHLREIAMRVLFVNPCSLPHVDIFLRLEPLGLECVAEEARRAG